MISKNASVYSLTEKFSISPDELTAALAARAERSCDALEPSTIVQTGKGGVAILVESVQKDVEPGMSIVRGKHVLKRGGFGKRKLCVLLSQAVSER